MPVTEKTIRELVKIASNLHCDQYGCRDHAEYAALTAKMKRLSAECSRRDYCRKHAEKWAEKHGIGIPNGEVPK